MHTCEVCGRPALRLTRVVIEGATMSVCDSCRRLGKTVADEPLPAGREGQPRPRPRLGGVKPTRAPEDLGRALERSALVKGYGQVVRKAREENAWSHEELGLRINEKASVIQKIEAEKLVPDDLLVRKLEHALRVKLLVEPPELPVAKVEPPRPLTLTLGDVVRLKDKETDSS
ncbi:MAG: multiprotein bridging factor aMBF1 [Candidatus Bathyarchaeia archaeon]